MSYNPYSKIVSCQFLLEVQSQIAVLELILGVHLYKAWVVESWRLGRREACIVPGYYPRGAESILKDSA